MSENSGPYAPRSGEPGAEPSTAEIARDEAADVGQHARAAGGEVAQTAGDQARQVAAEAGQHARDLFGEAQGQARDQASAQQQKAARQLHSVADELSQMAANGGQSGVATEFARQAADRMHGAASWIEQREPADLLDEVRHFARRRPGTFLIGAAVAGLAAGRLTRGLKDRGSDQQDTGPYGGRTTVPGVPAATTIDAGPGAGTAYPGGPAYPGATAYPEETAYPAESRYPAETEPGYPASPAYPAEPGDPAAPAYPPAPDDTAPYPADPVYQARSVTPEPVAPEPVTPPEPRRPPRYQGPAQS